MGGRATKTTSPPASGPTSPRLFILPLLLLSLVCAIIILGLAGNQIEHRGNSPAIVIFRVALTQTDAVLVDYNFSNFLWFSLLAGLVTVASCFIGLHHARVFAASSLGAAQAASMVALLLLMLPLALASKEIHTGGGFRTTEVKVLEAFVILLSFFHLLYTVLLFSGSHESTLPR